MPYTTLVAGTTITASWANASVRDQTIVPFATASARTSAITSPVEGMLTYQTDIKQFVGYDGVSWAGAIPTRVIARRSTDSSAVNNSTALVSDTQLQWAVAASAVYHLDLHVLYNSGTTPDFKAGWSVPAGLTMNWSWVGNDASLAVVNAGSYDQTSVPAMGGSGSDLWVHIWGIVNVSTTAGTLIFQWAQNTANASDTKVKAGSYGVLTRIA